MENRYCRECQTVHLKNENCYPDYKVYYEEYDESQIIRARDHEEAATRFAEDYNVNNDYSLMNDTIKVKVEFENEVKYFKVGAEPDVYYSSEEIKELSND